MEYIFKLADRQEVANGTTAFFFDKNGQDYRFKPGQHTDWTLENPPFTDAEGNTRTFSFVSDPDSARIEIATRMRDTAFKNSLKKLPLGSQIHAKEPMGRMTLHQDGSKPAVFLIGGIGITPIMSILRHWHSKPESRLMYLFYSNKTIADAPFWTELNDLAQENSHFHFVPSFTAEKPDTWSGERGRIDANMVKKYLPEPASAVFYSSGPPAMVSAMVTLAESLGVAEEFIRTEDFAGY